MGHRRGYLYIVLLGLGAIVPPGAAVASIEPDPAVVLGDIEGLGAMPQAMVTTPDGATWVGWVTSQCFGALRVQRIDPDGSLLLPGGIEMDIQDDCSLFRAELVPCSDGSVVVVSAPQPFPAQRISPTGELLWGDGVVVSATATIGDAVGLPGGDTLIGWHEGTTVHLGRYDADGAPVWVAPASLPTNTGSNKRVFSVEPDGADGAFILWDEPGSYTRSIWAARVSAAGQAVWNDNLHVVPMNGPPSFSGSSRHTDPVAIADGAGGFVLVWTFGAESGLTPVPLLMQRVTADGSRVLEPGGRRISLLTTRQFNPVLARAPVTADVFVAWRDGGLSAQELRAQRMTLTGTRVWGDDGVTVTPLGIGNASHFDASWNTEALSLVVSDEPANPGDTGVNVHSVDAAGVVDPGTTPVPGSVASASVRGVAVVGALVVSWYEVPTFQGQVMARGIGEGACPVPGDTNGDGVVDVDDVINVILDWGTDGSANGGDVDGSGVVGVDDLILVILRWTA